MQYYITMETDDELGWAMRKPSSREVARLAQVSQSAVSRTFTPGASVSAATRAKVLAAADELGYQPNRLPRLMQGDSASIIAVVTGQLSNPFHAKALDDIAGALTAAGKFVKLVHSDEDQALDEIVSELAEYRVGAVVTTLAVRDPETVEVLDRIGVPVIRFAPGAEGKRVWTVMNDNEDIGRQAARLLLQQGCRSFAFLAGAGSSNQDLRRKGFVDTLRENGISVRERVAPGHGHGDGMEGTRQLLAGGPVDGLLCGNDLVACGAIDEARSRGLGIGQHIRIIGCDNIAQSGWPPYSLTTFDQRTDKLAEAVVDMLDNGPPAERTIILEPDLIRRTSA